MRDKIIEGWHKDLPDSDVLVLVRVHDEEEPVTLGFLDGETWCYANAGEIEHSVIGWMHLEDAARRLDQCKPNSA